MWRLSDGESSPWTGNSAPGADPSYIPELGAEERDQDAAIGKDASLLVKVELMGFRNEMLDTGPPPNDVPWKWDLFSATRVMIAVGYIPYGHSYVGRPAQS